MVCWKLRHAHLEEVGLTHFTTYYINQIVGMALWMRIEGPHNYMVMELGSCAKRPLHLFHLQPNTQPPVSVWLIQLRQLGLD